MRKWVIAALIATVPFLAAAQGAYVTVMKAPGTGTITTTSTFQLVMAYNKGRIGGYVQNNGTNTMYVYLAGNAANCNAAATATSIELAPPGLSTAGDNVNLAYAGIHVVDRVCITGTSGDSYSYAEGINAPP